MKRKRALSITFLAVAAAALVAFLVAAGAFENWELDVHDILARAATEETRQSDLVSIIAIDEATLDWGTAYYLNSLGDPEAEADARRYSWPWDRLAYDWIALFLAEGRARALAFDVDFSSPSPKGGGSSDGTLGNTTYFQNEEGFPYIVHTINFEAGAGETEETVELSPLQETFLDGAAISVEGLAGSDLPFDRSDIGRYSNPILPCMTILDALSDAPALLRLGAVCTQPDDDSVYRRARPFVRYGDRCFPALGTAAALAWAESTGGKEATKLVLEGKRLTLETGDGPPKSVPLTPTGDIRIRWRDNGEEGSLDAGYFPTYSAQQVLRSSLHSVGLLRDAKPGETFLDPGLFEDRIVLLGANAAALHDQKATPVSEDYPGVKVHAAVVESLLRGEALHRPGAVPRALIAAAAAVLAMLVTLSGFSGLVKLGGVAALALAYAGASVWLFVDLALWLDLVAPLFGVAAAYSAGTTFNYFTEGRRSREISGLFQHFAPPDVVQQLIADPGILFTAGEIREITVFFSDIQGFTSLSNSPEMRKDPGRLTAHLNAYLTEMTHAITDCGGTLDKYIGDAVVAFFGAPIALENHAREACRAALECQKRLDAFNARAVEEELPPFVTRIGLYSGEANVGCVGSRDRFSYTAIGSTVNFASRLEGVNKVYGTLILAGGTTVEQAGSAIRTRRLDSVRVPGLLEDAPPLEIHQVLARDGDPLPLSEDLLARFEEARTHYDARRFTEAGSSFEALAEAHDDRPARTLAERCLRFAKDPPGVDWDGAYRIDSK